MPKSTHGAPAPRARDGSGAAGRHDHRARHGRQRRRGAQTGAFDYITKPFDQSEVRVIVKKALSRGTSPPRSDPARPRGAGVRHGIIGQSSAILELYAILDRVADTPTTVLVTGESGTGKELVAARPARGSSRRERPFIKVNCAAIPHELIESELFATRRGLHRRGGAKPGRFELAAGGTLFLDEIGTIPVEMQVKLLRVLQETEFERSADQDHPRRRPARRGHEHRSQEGDRRRAFSRDLYYRLNVVPIRLAPLREREGDTVLLARHFVEKSNARLGKRIEGIERTRTACSRSTPGRNIASSRT